MFIANLKLEVNYVTNEHTFRSQVCLSHEKLRRISVLQSLFESLVNIHSRINELASLPAHRTLLTKISGGPEAVGAETMPTLDGDGLDH